VRARCIGILAVSALLLLAPSRAATPPAEVSIEFATYRPSQLDVLPGETVSWTNVSQRTHTVTSDTGLFDSGAVPGGGHFAFRFNKVGTYPYYCTIHPSIVGEIDVRRVTLGLLPTAVVPIATRVEVTGRTAEVTQPVSIQRSLDGATFTTVASATPDPDGSWKATLTAEATGDYRAVSGSDVSQTRRLLVGVQRVHVRATRTGVSVTVAPSAPYALFLVEVYRRERFGWWPLSSGRVNYVSEAEVRVPRPARVRIVLVDKDGWTPLATSRVVVLGNG
jgi:plastocyanin